MAILCYSYTPIKEKNVLECRLTSHYLTMWKSNIRNTLNLGVLANQRLNDHDTGYLILAEISNFCHGHMREKTGCFYGRMLNRSKHLS